MLETLERAWSWTGLAPVAVLKLNAFGNILVRARDGKVWRICPEELSCEIVADSEVRLCELSKSAEFQDDWHMDPLVRLAEDHLGPLEEGRCYCLKIPAVLGGAYEVSNLGTNSLKELLAFSGDIARQIQDLPDGARIKISVK